MLAILKTAVHRAVWWAQAVRRAGWFVTRPRTVGVHGIPLTPAGEVVLVRLSYAAGWRLPGGGRKRDEAAEAAMLRELREEIGLREFTAIELVAGFQHRPDHRRGTASLFVVRGVRYRPRWSLEVAEVRAFALDALPEDTAPITHRLLGLAGDQLRDSG